MRENRFVLPALITCGLMYILSSLAMGEELQLPPLPPAHQYGTIVFSKYTAKSGRKPVVFSHWLHRRQFTCSFCHTDLGFSLKAGTTEISETENRAGKYCGACHNVRVSFTVKGNCKKCHSGNRDFSQPKFKELAGLPRSEFADVIDWVRAEQHGLIKPETKQREKMPFAKEITLKPAANGVTPVTFSHQLHGKQLECSSCHPELFNFKQQRTTHFTMKAMLGGDFCGTCHLNVAFPIHNCQRCHTGILPAKTTARNLH